MAELNIPVNTLMQGDNLGFLRKINSESIDLVATDPPFNKGKDFHATPDSLAAGASFHDRWSWERDVEQAWIDEIKDDFPAVWEVIDAANVTWGKDMGAFLCYMGVRILEMHRVLKPTGSLWMHCDDTAAAYLTMMLDAVFGRRNRRGLVTWERMQGNKPGGEESKALARNSDNILWYAKTSAALYNTQYTASTAATRKVYKYDDGDGRGVYRHSDASAPGGDGYRYDLGFGEKPPKRGYAMTEATARAWLAEGRLAVREGKVPQKKVYLSEVKGKALSNVWTDIPSLRGNKLDENGEPEDTGYPTQKPVELYERIVRASSNPGDVVLDPFCGCATTLVAAQNLGRNWLGMDHWDKAQETLKLRLKVEDEKFGLPTYHSADFIVRTDDGQIAAPPLKTKVKTRVSAPPGEEMPREQMVERLLEQQHGICAGCDRSYLDRRIWHLDHRIPRSEGGHNGISNRMLLCPPCNGAKGNTLTLTGLRKKNAKEGHMAGQEGG